MVSKANNAKISAIRNFYKQYKMGYLFLLPFVVLFSLFIITPVLLTVFLSFTNYNILQEPIWVGLENYIQLFMEDDVFLIALKNTCIFAFITGPIGFIVSFFVAWIIDQLMFRRFFALVFYAPSIVSIIAMSTVWGVFFASDRMGHINNFLLRLGIIGEPILWNIDPTKIMPMIMFVSVWMSMGTGFLVFLAGFQTVPKVLYEAAAIDGIKNRFQELIYITLPSMKPQLLFGAITTITISFSVFDHAVALAGLPSANYAGHTIVTHLFDYAFIRFDLGYASGVAFILFVLTFSLGKISMKVFSSEK